MAMVGCNRAVCNDVVDVNGDGWILGGDWITLCIWVDRCE